MSIVQITKGEEVRYLDPKESGRFLNTETNEVVLKVGLSSVPVEISEDSANFWVSQLQGLDDDVLVEIK